MKLLVTTPSFISRLWHSSRSLSRRGVWCEDRRAQCSTVQVCAAVVRSHLSVRSLPYRLIAHLPRCSSALLSREDLFMADSSKSPKGSAHSSPRSSASSSPSPSSSSSPKSSPKNNTASTTPPAANPTATPNAKSVASSALSLHRTRRLDCPAALQEYTLPSPAHSGSD